MTLEASGSLDDRHYLHDVIGLGDKLAVTTHQPVYGRNGVKLVDVGARIDQSLYERLMQHKLLPPIDDCVAVEGGVSALSLRDDIDVRLNERPVLAKLLDAALDRARLAALVSSIPLDSVASLKLTVAREQRPTLYQHTLDVVIVASAMAALEKNSDAWLTGNIEAALFHDIGFLHIPPALVESSRDLAPEELRHLYSHPVTGHLIVGKLPDVDPVVGAAILEHHERLDGSGYPRQLVAGQIGAMGQLLGVAEVAASLLNNATQGAALVRLSIILRMNYGKLSPTYSEHLTSLVSRLDPASQYSSDGRDNVLEACIQVSEIVEEWKTIRDELAAIRPLPSAIAILFDRVDALDHRLADVGLDLQHWQMIDEQSENDPLARHEVRTIAAESIWQLRSIAREAQRRWHSEMGADNPMPPALANWLRHIDSGKLEPVTRADGTP